ncbi:peptidylprolyl isomerase [Bdellovibrio sp. qaytius]|nr:peptidylprolyl isomerase [Bdellovibrio sp. qaytius]
MNSQIISFNCILKNKAGSLISSTYNRDVLTVADASETMLLGLSQGLKDLKKGEHRKISISANEAYGFYDLQKIILYPVKKLAKDLRIGQTISIIGKSGNSRTYKVLEFHNDFISLDGNHPLAGQDLVFEIEALEVRDATSDEISASANRVGTTFFH